MSNERQIEHVVAKYVRAADNRNGDAMASLFTDDADVEIFYHGADGLEPLGALRGTVAIGQAVAGMMAPHPPRGWSHHTTLNHLVEADGDSGRFDAQFLVYNVVGDERPATGWPNGAAGAQGAITPIESGYYRADLRRTGEEWKISHLVITHDLPVALPEN
jgi:SnoaL-like domain